MKAYKPTLIERIRLTFSALVGSHSVEFLKPAQASMPAKKKRSRKRTTDKRNKELFRLYKDVIRNNPHIGVVQAMLEVYENPKNKSLLVGGHKGKKMSFAALKAAIYAEKRG